jgi:hypothetical protein
VQVPAQRVDDRSALRDKGVTEVDQSRISRSGPSSRATGSPGSRSAARAIASASMGSDLP